MSNTTTLKLPNGNFSHSDLAIANGKTNQQIWAEYSRLRKEGIIVSAGTRSTGKGKPTSLWKVADGVPVPLVAKVTPAILAARRVDEVKISTQPKMKLPTIQNKPQSVAPITHGVIGSVFVPAKPESTLAVVTETTIVVESLPVVVPTEAPIVTETVEVIQPVPVVRNLTCQVTEIDAVCPFCQTKLLSVETSGGYKVWCPVNDLKVCSCSENPYGCANTVKNAVEILNDKFFKHRSPAK
jgi:hypothetical protein